MRKTKIKICGLTSKEDAEYLVENQVEYGGMVLFFEKSKRCIDIKKAKELVLLLKGRVKTVAVTVSPDVTQLLDIENAGFDYIQIHGFLSREVYDKASIPIIRAINVKSSDFEIEEIKKEKIKGVLFDAGTPGSGKIFDWDKIENISFDDKILFLAGGLNEANVSDAIEKIGPDVVDVSSGVEYDEFKTGKDPEKIKNFVCKVRNLKKLD